MIKLVQVKENFQKRQMESQAVKGLWFTSRRPLGLTGSSGTGAVGTELVSTWYNINIILLDNNSTADFYT